MHLTPPYEQFSYAYDRMMRNVNYTRWCDYIETLFKMYGCEPQDVLDLACGTGSLTLLLASKGYNVTGLDRAEGMLNVAREKADSENQKISLHQGDMINFKLDQKFDAILCTYDSINYAIDESELSKMFVTVSKHLTIDGLFIFDVTTERNIVEHFHNKTFSENHQDYSYIWKNNYLYNSKMCRTFLTFFIREGELFNRYEEVHQQRIYEVQTIDKLLKDTGFKRLSAYDMYTFNKWSRSSDRINFTAKLA